MATIYLKNLGLVQNVPKERYKKIFIGAGPIVIGIEFDYSGAQA